jgi:hypothetical protein
MQQKNLENKQFSAGSSSLILFFSVGSLIRIYLEEAGSVTQDCSSLYFFEAGSLNPFSWRVWPTTRWSVRMSERACTLLNLC